MPLRIMSKVRVKKRRIKKPSIISAPDKQLLLVTFALMIFGLMAVLSAGAPEGTEVYNNPAYFAYKQFVFFIFGLIAMFFFVKFDYRKIQKYAWPAGIIALVLLVATFIPELGQENYGSKRWLRLSSLSIQPSELAKPACIFLMVSALAQAKTIKDSNLLKSLGLIFAMLIIVLLQPNLSMAIMITLITSSLLFVGGASPLLLLMGLSAAVPIVTAYIFTHKYQLNRITGWWNPWSDPQVTGYNLIQSWYAIGSGGFFGAGYGFSKQKYFWLPFRHTDFIFAIIAEELGFLGCLILIGLFIMFIYRGFRISYRCNDYFGKLLAFGITFTIGIQALINIGVATGVLPVTGMTLPLVSYGGSSVVITLAMIGILLNISRKRIRKIQPKSINYEY